MVVYLILVTLLVVCWPSEAFAWGPGTHLETALKLLESTATFSPLVAPLMKKYHKEFVYGMVSADMLVGKKYAGVLEHCHNWGVGWRILEKCRSERQKASGYGYLTHLAADTIAHNYYIPYMVIKSYAARARNHTYWEIRFDNHVKRRVWDEAREIIHGDFAEFDGILERTLKRPMFSFRTNKRIFNTIVLLQQFRQLRRTVELHSRFSNWPLKPPEILHYKGLIMKTTAEFLSNLRDSACLDGDPSGRLRLKYAGRMRKSLKRYLSKGLVEAPEVDIFIEGVKRELEKSIYEPDVCLKESYEVL